MSETCEQRERCLERGSSRPVVSYFQVGGGVGVVCTVGHCAVVTSRGPAPRIISIYSRAAFPPSAGALLSGSLAWNSSVLQTSAGRGRGGPSLVVISAGCGGVSTPRSVSACSHVGSVCACSKGPPLASAYFVRGHVRSPQPAAPRTLNQLDG